MDRSGGLWVSTEERGIDVFRNGLKVRNFNHENSAVSNNISCAFADLKNNLWFGGVDGAIYWINPINGQVKNITGFSIRSARVRSIYEDSKKKYMVLYRFWHRLAQFKAPVKNARFMFRPMD